MRLLLAARIDEVARETGEYPDEVTGLFEGLTDALRPGDIVYLGDCIRGGSRSTGDQPLILFLDSCPRLEKGLRQWQVAFALGYTALMSDHELRDYVARLRERIELGQATRVDQSYVSRIERAIGR